MFMSAKPLRKRGNYEIFLICHRLGLQGSLGSCKITSYGELTTPATRGYPDWSVVCCEETVGQSNTSI